MLILRIARNEVRDAARDGRIRWAVAIVASLLVVALLTGWTHQRAISAQHRDAEQHARQTWLTQPSKDPHSAAHYGSCAFKPYGPLTLFDSGINPYVGVAAFLEAHKQNDFQFRPAQDRSALARLGQLTAAAALQYLVPILIILFAFTRFAGEREDGTLRQLIATGVSPGALAAGKVAGIAAALGLVVVPAGIAGTLALALASGMAPLAADAPRIVLLMLLYGVYIAIWVAISLAVSARLRRSSHALAVLVGFWAVNAALVPRLASDVASTLYPTPTAIEFATSVLHDTYGGPSIHAYNVRRAADLRARLFAQHGVSRVEDLPVNFRGIDYLEREEHANRVWDRHYHRVWSTFAAQTRLQEWGALAAPLVAVRTISMALVGADLAHHRRFAMAAEAYRRDLVGRMNHDLAYGGSSARLGAYAATTHLWAEVRDFRFERPDVRLAIRRHGLSAGLLGAWTAAAFVALAISTRRLAVE